MPPQMSRRTFLRLALLLGTGVAALGLDRATQPAGLARVLPWLARGQVQRLAGRPARVGLASCSSYDDARDCIADLWRQSAMPTVAGKRVLVKPNLLDIIEGHPVTTAPEVIAAVLDVLAELGAAELVVGDGSAFRRDAWPVVEASGLASVLKQRKLPFVDLNYDDPQPVPARGEWFLQTQQLWLPRHAREADLIVSLPKLKTHHWAGVSLSLKNLFGILPGARYGWPKNMLHFNGIAPSILGIYESLPPVVAVLDGIVGMEGDGPLFGTSVAHGLLAAGSDPVAVDVTTARLMGFSPEAIDHLRLAIWAGVGQGTRIETGGAAPEALRRSYQPAPTL